MSVHLTIAQDIERRAQEVIDLLGQIFNSEEHKLKFLKDTDLKLTEEQGELTECLKEFARYSPEQAEAQSKQLYEGVCKLLLSHIHVVRDFRERPSQATGVQFTQFMTQLDFVSEHDTILKLFQELYLCEEDLYLIVTNEESHKLLHGSSNCSKELLNGFICNFIQSSSKASVKFLNQDVEANEIAQATEMLSMNFKIIGGLVVYKLLNQKSFDIISEFLKNIPFKVSFQTKPAVEFHNTLVNSKKIFFNGYMLNEEIVRPNQKEYEWLFFILPLFLKKLEKSEYTTSFLTDFAIELMDQNQYFLTNWYVDQICFVYFYGGRPTRSCQNRFNPRCEKIDKMINKLKAYSFTFLLSFTQFEHTLAQNIYIIKYNSPLTALVQTLEVFRPSREDIDFLYFLKSYIDLQDKKMAKMNTEINQYFEYLHEHAWSMPIALIDHLGVEGK